MRSRTVSRVFEAVAYGIAFLVLRLLLFTTLASRLVPAAMRTDRPRMDPEYREVTKEMVLYLASDCRLD